MLNVAKSSRLMYLTVHELGYQCLETNRQCLHCNNHNLDNDHFNVYMAF